MDRSKLRQSGNGRDPGAVRLSASGVPAADDTGANLHDYKPFANAYAEASQASVIGKKPYPVDCKRSVASDPLVMNDAGKEATAEKPVKTAIVQPKADADLEPVEVLLPPAIGIARRAEPAVMTSMMTVKDVAAYLKVSVSKIWRLSKRDPSFPSAIRFGGSTRWERQAIDCYIDGLRDRSRSDR
ncbi:MAG: helix-turn-helix domain-containing protein [Roseovarius sp.]|nr:helix-turn-helix domain-containing protein [Roseovarius sp.]